MRQIIRAEVTYYVKQGEIARAKAVALETTIEESNALYIFQEIMAEQIPSMLEKKDFESTFNVLSNWTFFEDPTYSAERIQAKSIDSNKDDYNSEIGTYNDLVFKLFNAAIVNNNQEFVKKSFLLFQDEMVLNTKKYIGKDNYGDALYNVTYKKDNKALRDAQRRLAEYNKLK